MEFIEGLKRRTKDMALRVIRLTRELPQQPDAWVIQKQILRSATSVAANYRAACRARSWKEYYAKISIVIEECDETLFWLELIEEAEIFGRKRLEAIYKETEELLAIFAKSRKNSK